MRDTQATGAALGEVGWGLHPGEEVAETGACRVYGLRRGLASHV